MSEYKLKTGRLDEKVVNAYKGMEDKFVDTFLKEEEDGSLKTGVLLAAAAGTVIAAATAAIVYHHRCRKNKS